MFITFQKIATFIIHLIAQFCLFVHNNDKSILLTLI
ncbi:hypothetical protein T4C_8285 [Trichinella pseudospiralis]|uniref:Uncharacterized protein n=1 Tax=Trichinella pseudospiralis TaxID=6337 RepID=A0A0V1GAD2_TRIPS|nr:hypothetical protein T4C_8285 [Trichinella pseudospiralis]